MMQHHQQLEGEEVVIVCAVCGTVFFILWAHNVVLSALHVSYFRRI